MSSAPRGEDPRSAAEPEDEATAGDGPGRAHEMDTDAVTEAAEAGAPAKAAEAAEEQASVDVMRLLSEHVPLTLLADLAQPTGPDSPDILEAEGLPDVAWWESAEETQH